MLNQVKENLIKINKIINIIEPKTVRMKKFIMEKTIHPIVRLRILVTSWEEWKLRILILKFLSRVLQVLWMPQFISLMIVNWILISLIELEASKKRIKSIWYKLLKHSKKDRKSILVIKLVKFITFNLENMLECQTFSKLNQEKKPQSQLIQVKDHFRLCWTIQTS